MQCRTALFMVMFLSLFLMSNTLADNTIYMQTKVFYDSESKAMELRALGLDITETGEDYFVIIIRPWEFEEIQALGFQTEVIHEDMTKFYRERLDTDKTMGGYLTLSEINDSVDALIAAYPDIISAKVSIGQTIEGRDQWAFKISDNPNVDEDEPEILFSAAIHAREVITPLVILTYIDHLTTNYATDPDIQALVDNREIWFIACNNPDGYFHNEVIAPGGGGMWRKNRKDNGDSTYGVDLNRNFGYEWGYNDFGSSGNTEDLTYRGTAPFSEPETQNLRDFHIAHDFQIAIYFHSFSNILYTAWGYNNSLNPDWDICNIMMDSITVLNGYANGLGMAGINGCTDDWIYGEQTLKNKTFGFTFEVGNAEDGFWPQTARIPQLTTENIQPCVFFTEMAGKLDSLYRLRPPVVPVHSAPAHTEVLDYDVSWTFEDYYNPAVEFELSELTDHVQLTDSAVDFNYVAENNGFEINTDRYYSEPSCFFNGTAMVNQRYMVYSFPLPIEDGDSLKFMTYYDMGNHTDYAYVYVIADGMGQTIPGNLTTDINAQGYNWGHGITGTSGGWVEALYDLSQFEGQYITVVIIYMYNTLGFTEGIYIDDIYPINQFNNETTFSVSGVENLVSFTDKPENTYYYRVRAKDAQDQWSYFSPITETLVLLPQYICGDANADQTVNVSDAVHIINYVFVSGNPPDPYESGDANCDFDVNVSDAVWIINYVFVGGAAPCECE
jgi:Zinc carboxypeptidase/Immune inhibitor A-like, MAM domain/Dockerin type I domain